MSDGWQDVPFVRLWRSNLLGRQMRLLSRIPGVGSGLAMMVVGTYQGPVRIKGKLYVGILPNPDGDLVDERQRELAREILARRAVDVAAGRDPGRELWGPIDARNLLQVAR